ncbi:MAG: hypothetical protein JRD68_11210 [Deltaproteobacteria bacterium]|nr:hypothetical protein [Deltaproteobacteria bacterium]
MNWLERYVAAVKRYLPSKIRDDVGEELLSLLEEKVEAAEETKGEPVKETEILAMLKSYGHPLQVASSYRSRQVLISETLFPLYKQVLKYIFLGSISLLLIVSLVSASGHNEWGQTRFFPDVFNGVWSATLQVIGLISLCFYFLDGIVSKIDLFGKWDPHKLAPVFARGDDVPLGSTIWNLILGVLWFGGLTAITNEFSRDIFIGQSDSQLASLIFWLKIQVTFALILTVVNLYKPYWTRAKLLFSAFLTFLFVPIAVKGLLIQDIIGQFVSLIGNTVDMDQVSMRLDLVNLIIRIPMVIVLILGIFLSARAIKKAFGLKYRSLV